MSTTAISMSTLRTDLLRPILWGGLLAATFDLISAALTFGVGVPRAIAGGLLGRDTAMHGGAGVWTLGVVLHYLILLTAATIYCLASRKLQFLKQHWLVCGLFYGIAIFLVMNLVVLPLSALHSMGPYKYPSLVQGIVGHMLLVGLPISFSLRKFG
jgi:hypothetical protein